MAQQSVVGQGFLFIDTSRSHSDVPHLVGLLLTSDQTDADASTWQHTLTRDQHPPPLHPPALFEPAFLASERLRPHAIDLVTTGIGNEWWIVF